MIRPGDADIARLIGETYKKAQFKRGDIDFDILPGKALVSIAGTKDWKDWITNLRQFPWYVKNIGWLPSGYLKVARLVHAKVLAHAYTYDLNLREYTVAGHSAGGAIAKIVAALLAKEGIFVHRVFTCGAPDVGQLRHLVTYVDLDELLNGDDLVPRSTFYPKAVLKDHIGEASGFDHPISAYEEELELIDAS